MIFGGIYGVIGVTCDDDASRGQWFTFYCWSTVTLATCLVPIFFLHEPMKNFLYERLGKDYIISRVGNPGLKSLTRLGGIGAALAGIQSLGVYQSTVAYESAQNTANATLKETLAQSNSDCNKAIETTMNSGLDPREQQRKVGKIIDNHLKFQTQAHDIHQQSSTSNTETLKAYESPLAQLAGLAKSAENTERMGTAAKEAGRAVSNWPRIFGGKDKGEN